MCLSDKQCLRLGLSGSTYQVFLPPGHLHFLRLHWVAPQSDLNLNPHRSGPGGRFAEQVDLLESNTSMIRTTTYKKIDSFYFALCSTVSCAFWLEFKKSQPENGSFGLQILKRIRRRIVNFEHSPDISETDSVCNADRAVPILRRVLVALQHQIPKILDFLDFLESCQNRVTQKILNGMSLHILIFMNKVQNPFFTIQVYKT